MSQAVARRVSAWGEGYTLMPRGSCRVTSSSVELPPGSIEATSGAQGAALSIMRFNIMRPAVLTLTPRVSNSTAASGPYWRSSSAV